MPGLSGTISSAISVVARPAVWNSSTGASASTCGDAGSSPLASSPAAIVSIRPGQA